MASSVSNKKTSSSKGKSSTASSARRSPSGTKKSTSSRSTATRSGGSRNTRTNARAKTAAHNAQVTRDLWVMFYIAVAALLFLSLLGLIGRIGGFLASFQFGLFGSMAYLFPFLLLGLAAFGMVNMKQYPANTWTRILMALLTFSFLCALAEMVGCDGLLRRTIKEYYSVGKGTRLHGGLFGGFWCKMFLGAFGKLGSYVILFVLFLAGLVLTLGRAILTPLGLKSREVAHAIKDETKRYRAETEERRIIAERRFEERQMRRAEEREAKAREAEANRSEILRELDARMAARKKLQPENTISLNEVKTKTEPEPQPRGISERITDTFLGGNRRKKEAEAEAKKTAAAKAAKADDGQMKLNLDPEPVKEKTAPTGPVLPAGARLDQLLKEMDEHAVGIRKENRTLSELGALEDEKAAPKISRKPVAPAADAQKRRGVAIYGREESPENPAAAAKPGIPSFLRDKTDPVKENPVKEEKSGNPDLEDAFSEYERSRAAEKKPDLRIRYMPREEEKASTAGQKEAASELEDILDDSDLLSLTERKPADVPKNPIPAKPAAAPKTGPSFITETEKPGPASDPEEEPSWEDPREQLKKIRDDSIFRQESNKDTSGSGGQVLSRPAGGSSAGKGSTPVSVSAPRAGAPAGSTSSLPAPQEPPKKEYKLPNINLLTKGKPGNTIQESTLQATADLLEETLRNFGVEVSVTDVACGPSVIRYELKPEMGVKVSRISALADDIKLALAAAEIRIEAPIPGKSAVGIEVPNPEKQTVYLRTILESDPFTRMTSKIGFAVGQDIGGQIIVADLAKMPHLLVAGTTGSGKSVFLNSLILSILYRAKPEEVQMIMVDPKKVELVDYNGIPHLRIPVVTEPNLAAEALNGAVKEMTGRYKKFADLNVRDIKSYNAKIRENPEEYSDREPLPQIVIIVDEFADLMMTASKDVEQAVVRLAQLARAAGIHLVIATQRPTANVITGLIKSNIQSRVALTVASGLDSRTILDMNGAEKLLGHGDMLFYPTGYAKPIRVQGCWVTDQEIEAVTSFWKKQGAVTEEQMKKQSYTWLNDPVERENPVEDERDEMFLKAAEYIIDSEKASIGNLQRVFRIGFNRAARIMDQLADAGIVGKDEGTKARQIMLDRGQFEDWKRDNGY